MQPYLAYLRTKYGEIYRLPLTEDSSTAPERRMG
jgi:hypothetical protein